MPPIPDQDIPNGSGAAKHQAMLAGPASFSKCKRSDSHYSPYGQFYRERLPRRRVNAASAAGTRVAALDKTSASMVSTALIAGQRGRSVFQSDHAHAFHHHAKRTHGNDMSSVSLPIRLSAMVSSLESTVMLKLMARTAFSASPGSAFRSGLRQAVWVLPARCG